MHSPVGGQLRTASPINVMLREDARMSGIKKDTWSEAQVLALPDGEHNFFDRKSGQLLDSRNSREQLGKVLSALANSGGGHVILGQRDDGTFDGVASSHGRTPTREWLEQLIPHLLIHPLEDFRVHEVVPDTPTMIPIGRVVIVIDVGDSALAPHQAESDHVYYYRVGSHSQPAPHLYLETLRNRLVRPSLTPELVAIKKLEAYRHDGGIFLETSLTYHVRNVGRVAAYKWALVIDGLSGVEVGRKEDYFFQFSSFPKGTRGRDSFIETDTTILPSLAHGVNRDFGLHLRPKSLTAPDIEAELRTLIPPELRIHCRAVTETSSGETIAHSLSDHVDYSALAASLTNLEE